MEKKKFIALLFLFIVIQGFSQSNKGKVMINGKGNFWTESSEEDSFYSNYLARNTSKNTSGMINLNVGYFVGNSFALGLSGTFEKVIQKSTTSNTIDTKSISDIVNQTFSIGIFGRYNYMIKESKFGIFLQLDNSYSFGKNDNVTTLESLNYPPIVNRNFLKGTGFKLGLTPGLLYFINNKISIETTIGEISYQSFNWENKIQNNLKNKNNGFHASIANSTILFGLTFYFGGIKLEE